MGRETAERVALMSIHPQYAAAIFRGDKKVEFRKRRLAADIKTVFVYATAPVSRVLGTFDIEIIIEDSPENLWKLYGHLGVINHEGFFEYFKGKDSAYAILLKCIKEFEIPLLLKEIEPKSIAPQSFVYLRRHQLLIQEF